LAVNVEAAMTERDGLFEDLPEERAPSRGAPGAPRLREARRDQLELQAVDLESLVPPDHPARAVWAYTGVLDLSDLMGQVKAREGAPGRPPADPRILLALWLYASTQAVGSARELARLCEAHAAYRWICGGVTMNHHTLSDFRVSQEDLLDRLLTQGVAALVADGLVTLERLAQDGVRLRASAGSGSFRRRGRLETILHEAETRIAALKEELDADPGASRTRQQAAIERAAREQAQRAKAALEKMKKLEAERARRGKSHKKATEKQTPPRASTTDPDARVMKMADGGFRPAYNGQLVTDPRAQVIVAVEVDTTGSDGGLMGPMPEKIAKTYGQRPRQYLVDGGFSKLADIEALHAQGVEVFAPPPNNKHETDPCAPRESDGPGVAAWRKRMASDEGKAVYAHRAQHECANAQLRNRGGLDRLRVRGRQKVRTALLWFAVAHNLMRAIALRNASGVALAA
jgi:transposase